MAAKQPEPKENDLWFAFNNDVDSVIATICDKNKAFEESKGIVKAYCSTGIGVNNVKYGDLLRNGLTLTFEKHVVGDANDATGVFYPCKQKFSGMLHYINLSIYRNL